MTHNEELEQLAFNDKIEVINNYTFESSRIKGLYCENVIALSKSIHSMREKTCVLAEEIGHHKYTVGNILDQTKVQNRKQERKARIWAYNKLIGLQGIINAYEHRCTTRTEIADFLDVTEEFLEEAITAYKEKYGVCISLDNYTIYFEPCFGVMSSFQNK